MIHQFITSLKHTKQNALIINKSCYFELAMYAHSLQVKALQHSVPQTAALDQWETFSNNRNFYNFTLINECDVCHYCNCYNNSTVSHTDKFIKKMMSLLCKTGYIIQRFIYAFFSWLAGIHLAI